MTTLMAERRRSLIDAGQETLFGEPEVTRAPAAPPWSPLESPARPSGPPRRTPVELPDGNAAASRPAAPGVQSAEPEPRDVGDQITAAGSAPAQAASGPQLIGPTLDDVMTRAWEGLVIGLPVACPVCHGEVVPSIGGSLSGICTHCGVTID
jgi:hypothetical protein